MNTSESPKSWLFMGVEPDPEMDVIEARGIVRIYDGTREDPARRRLIEERERVAKERAQ